MAPTKKQRKCRFGKTKQQKSDKLKREAKRMEAASDREVRMLFDLSMPTETFNDKNCSSPSDTCMNEVSTNPNDSEPHIIEAKSHSETKIIGDELVFFGDTVKNEDFQLQVFDANLRDSLNEESLTSSPESVFSDNNRGSITPECLMDDLSTSPLSDLSLSILPPDYDDFSKEVIKIIDSIDIDEDSCLESLRVEGPLIIPRDDIEAIQCIDPELYEMDVDQEVAQLAHFINCPPIEPMSCQQPLILPPMNQVHHLQIPPILDPLGNHHQGKIVAQYATHCFCPSCPSSSRQIGLPLGKTPSPSKDKSNFRVYSYTPKYFEDKRNEEAKQTKLIELPSVLDEPGVVKITKPGTRRARNVKNKMERVHQFTYAFKPPSEYMIKTWLARHQSDETTSKKNDDLTELPSKFLLTTFPAIKRWEIFKQRYAQIDQATITSARECCHCNTLFDEIENYMAHLDRHNIIHESFCVDDDCPLAVIGFRTKWELRRHIRNDHLDQYAPYLSSHMDEMLQNDLTRKMLNSVYVCKYECCRKIFYRLDSMARHEKLRHSSKKLLADASKVSSQKEGYAKQRAGLKTPVLASPV